MGFSEFLRRFLIIFLILAVILPIGTTFLFLFGLLLERLGDSAGRNVLDTFALILAAFWLTDLAAATVLLGFDRLGDWNE